MNEKWTIGEVAKLFDVSTDTLRYYETCSSMAERGIIPHQCKGTANYDAIVSGAVPAKEKQNRFQDTRSL